MTRLALGLSLIFGIGMLLTLAAAMPNVWASQRYSVGDAPLLRQVALVGMLLSGTSAVWVLLLAGGEWVMAGARGLDGRFKPALIAGRILFLVGIVLAFLWFLSALDQAPMFWKWADDL